METQQIITDNAHGQNNEIEFLNLKQHAQQVESMERGCITCNVHRSFRMDRFLCWQRVTLQQQKQQNRWDQNGLSKYKNGRFSEKRGF